MKKWLFWIGILFLISYSVIEHKPKADQQHLNNTSDGTMLTLSKNHIYQGNLLLINTHYPVPPNTEASGVVSLSQHIKLIKGFGLLDNSIQLSTNMLNKFSKMVEAARKDGVNHFLINSGYRDYEKQQELYKQLGAEYAMPAGYSEHNLGLSIDIGSTLGKMISAPEGQWLEQNAWKYGFILRYPQDKTNITGIQHEPWHFRYVGLPHSAIIQKNGFVLEEYLDYLKKQKQIHISIDHLYYEITYIPFNKKNVISVPVKGRYEISGNNMDGIIMTTWAADRADSLQEEGAVK